MQADAGADLEHGLALEVEAEAREMGLARVVDGVGVGREEDREGIFGGLGSEQALEEAGHYFPIACFSMRKPFCR